MPGRDPRAAWEIESTDAATGERRTFCSVNAACQEQKFVFASPNMAGKFIGAFYRVPLVYLLDFAFNDKRYVKVGWTDDLRERMDAHFNELPGCQLYSAVCVANPFLVERRWKEDFRAYNEVVTVNDGNKPELFTGLTLEDAELHLIQLVNDAKSKDEVDVEMEKLRMQHELNIKQQEVELKQQEVEMRRLDLQILQARVAAGLACPQS
jgi:hypothetical protein